MCLSILFTFGCEDEPTKTKEILVQNAIETTLIDNWDRYEFSNPTLSRDGEGYPILAEEYYLMVTSDQMVIDGQVFSAEDENVKSVYMEANQLYTVSTENDTTYYYDYYRNVDTGVLWLTPETTAFTYYAVDPTEVDSLNVITPNDTTTYYFDIDDYAMCYVHGSGPELQLYNPYINSQVTTLTPTFNWENTLSTYYFQVRTDTMFSSTEGFTYNDTLTAANVTKTLENFTTYYWRVRADNSAWSDIWNFGTNYLPQITAPMNTQFVGRKPTFTWSTYQGASLYTLQIAEDLDFTQNLIQVETAATSYIHPELLSIGQKYYCRLKSDVYPDNWSEISYFTVNKKVELATGSSEAIPEDGAIGVALPVNFSWDVLQNATNYTIQVASDEEMANILIDEDITTNSYTDNGVLVTNSLYYWRVNCNVATAWSNVSSFSTNDYVILSSPENGTVQNIILDFTWREFPDAEDYSFQIAEDAEFTNIVIDVTAIEDSTYTLETNLEGESQYYWRVKHNSSEWCTPWSFTTVSLDNNNTEPNYPSDGASNVGQVPTLNWLAMNNVTYYLVQLASDSNFNNIVISSVESSAEYDVSDDDIILNLDTTYYWRIRSDKSEWSNTWSFTTLTAIPQDIEAVVLPETPHKIDLTWYCPNGEQTDYNIERSSDGTTWELASTIDSENDYYCDLGLDEGMTYYYRLCSVTPTGNSAYSDVTEATTGSFSLGTNAPTLIDVAPGSFSMGSSDGDADELPIRNITLNNELQIGTYEITNQQYCALLNWALGKGMIKGVLYASLNYATNAVTYTTFVDTAKVEIDFDNYNMLFKVNTGKQNYAIDGITWKGAASYANWLSAVQGLNALYSTTYDCTVYGTEGYRLPTEAEWEYSATNEGTDNFLYSGSDIVDDVAQYFGNAGSIMAVGGLAANGLGTYDMSGNVWEWCNDYYGDYDATQLSDPTGPASGTYRVLRGGSWEYDAWYQRNTNRSRCKPNLAYGKVNTSIGFRIVKVLP